MEMKQCFSMPKNDLNGSGGTMNPGDNERRYKGCRAKTGSDKEANDGE